MKFKKQLNNFFAISPEAIQEIALQRFEEAQKKPRGVF